MSKTTTNEQARTDASRIAGECLGWRSRQLGRMVSRLFDDALRPHGLNNAQLSLLTAVETIGPVRPGALSRILGAEKSTVTRNVAVLADRGWVQSKEIAQEPGKRLEVTQEGRSLIVTAFPDWERAQQQVLEALGDAASQTLTGYIEGVVKLM